MGETIVYKVKDLKTGLFMNKSCGWDKKGKTWDSLGKLRLTLGNKGYWKNGASYGSNSNEEFGDNVKILAIKIVETEDNTSPLDDFVNRTRRYVALGNKYGRTFQELVERIEAQGQADQFAWVLVADSGWDHNNQCHTGDFAEMLEVIKSLKLKQNKDFKKASGWNSNGCVAFASKQIAMTVRLSMSGRCKGIDIKECVETNLDEESGSSV